jgi:hypothetical protein
VSAFASFCSGDSLDLIGSPVVYEDGVPVLRHQPHGTATGTHPRHYYFFVNVARRESLKSIPPQRGYDLQRIPEDICFCLRGGNQVWFAFKTQEAAIPKSAIAAAFRSQERPGFTGAK